MNRILLTMVLVFTFGAVNIDAAQIKVVRTSWVGQRAYLSFGGRETLHTYADQRDEEFGEQILRVISRFEDANPQLKLKNWRLNQASQSQCLGMWLEFEKK